MWTLDQGQTEQQDWTLRQLFFFFATLSISNTLSTALQMRPSPGRDGTEPASPTAIKVFTELGTENVQCILHKKSEQSQIF
jgi:hypothetical protein